MQIVETVTAGTLSAMVAARDAAHDADMVELRLDHLEPGPVDVAAVLAGRTKPVIVTCRPQWEGGRFTGGEDERLRIIGDAMRGGAEFVDVEWRADRSRLPVGTAARVVISHHDFERVPADLADRVRDMHAAGAAVIKIAAMAGCLGDVVRLRDAMGAGGPDVPHVAIAMGAAGLVTRVLPSRFGSCWTYAGNAAPGQIDAATLRQRFRADRVTGATRVFALAGRPLGHSASPAMHNAGFASAGLDAVYVPLESPDAEELLAVAFALGVEGLSVTAPLKSDLAARCTCDAFAQAIGAVNTMRRRADGGWDGVNFDAQAFLDPLDARGVTLSDASAVVMGAGGAARAAVFALKSRGARVAIAARDPQRARRVADEFGVAVADWPPKPGWDVLVNATPVGTAPNTGEAPVPKDAVTGGLVYDLVYNPRETMLVRWARERGAAGIGGLEMLVSQAMRQFTWWTGAVVDRAVFEAAAARFVM